MMETLSDVTIVRWAVVEALRLHGKGGDVIHNDQVYKTLLSLGPEELLEYLEIDDLRFARRVQLCLTENEAGRAP
jgi:hypothetical protein